MEGAPDNEQLDQIEEQTQGKEELQQTEDEQGTEPQDQVDEGQEQAREGSVMPGEGEEQQAEENAPVEDDEQKDQVEQQNPDAQGEEEQQAEDEQRTEPQDEESRVEEGQEQRGEEEEQQVEENTPAEDEQVREESEGQIQEQEHDGDIQGDEEGQQAEDKQGGTEPNGQVDQAREGSDEQQDEEEMPTKEEGEGTEPQDEQAGDGSEEPPAEEEEKQAADDEVAEPTEEEEEEEEQQAADDEEKESPQVVEDEQQDDKELPVEDLKDEQNQAEQREPEAGGEDPTEEGGEGEDPTEEGGEGTKQVDEQAGEGSEEAPAKEEEQQAEEKAPAEDGREPASGTVVLEYRDVEDEQPVLKAPPRPVGVPRLPRYFSIIGREKNSKLGIQDRGFKDMTTLVFFNVNRAPARLVTHEVVYQENAEKLCMIRAANNRFWRRDTKFIVADKVGVPSYDKDKSCYFSFEVSQTDQTVKLRSAVDGASVHFSGTVINIKDAFVVTYISCVSTSKRLPEAFSFVDASMTALKLPPYILLKKEDGWYFNLHTERGDKMWLQSNNKEKSLDGTFAVVPLANGFFAFQSVVNQKFWRNTEYWIWTDVGSTAEAESNRRCHFDVTKLGDKVVALRSVWSNSFLQGYTDFWENCLSANAHSSVKFILEDAATSRLLSNLKFLPFLAHMVEGPEAIVAGESSLENTQEYKTDLTTTVAITRAKTSSRKTTTSNTFKLEVATKISGGVPVAYTAEVGVTFGYEKVQGEEVGNETIDSVQYQTAYTVKDVPKDKKVTVRVECTRAEFNIPFTYTAKTVRFDGVDISEEVGVDGVFEGVFVYNIRANIENPNTNVIQDAANVTKDVVTLDAKGAVKDSGKLVQNTLDNVGGIFKKKH